MTEKNVNQVELAKRSGISQGLISSYIRGGRAAKEPSLRNLLALQRALHCSLEELTGIPLPPTVDLTDKPTPEGLAFARKFEALTPEDQKLLLDMIRRMKKEESPPSDTDVKSG